MKPHRDDASELLQTILRTGVPLENPDALRAMRPGLRQRDYVDIFFRVTRARLPDSELNRHERRARQAKQARSLRGLNRWVDDRLDVYERIVRAFSDQDKRLYGSRCARGPHVESPFAPHALDTPDIAEVRRAAFEIEAAIRIYRSPQARFRFHRLIRQAA